MVAQLGALAADRRPALKGIANWSRFTLAGRSATLCTVFGLLLAVGLWTAAEPPPPSAWQELGLAAESPALRRVYQRKAEGLAALFAANDYELAALRSGADSGVPRLGVSALPRDMAEIADSEARKALFLRTLLPLVLQANKELERARAKVIAALDAEARGRLGATDALWLETVAHWYGAAPGDAADLLSRIDAVPPSLVLAQAAQESGWGTSRFALAANALFGQRIWGEAGDGLVPAAAERDGFKVRAFADLMSAVRAYLHNLNSHPAYAELRSRRARARALGAPPHALELTRGLQSYSEEGAAYVAALNAVIRGNDLQALDGARLRDGGR